MANTEDKFDYDLICIGGGSGGLACAKEAASLGARVACLDFVKPTPMNTKWGLGGTCVNVGCIPKKQMHYAALLGNNLHDAVSYGWHIPHENQIVLSWQKLIKEIQYTVKSSNWLLKVELRSKNVEYFNGIGSFIDPHTINVKINNRNQRRITSKYIVIAIGCRPVYPNIPGAIEFGITSDDFFSLSNPPGKTLIVGGGYVSLECGGILNELGCDVTIMSRAQTLSYFDRQMAGLIVDNMAAAGVKFLSYYLPISVEETKEYRLLVKYVHVPSETERVDVFDTIIWAMGRRPLLEDVNIKAINLKCDNGEIVADEYEETNVPGVFAIGDVVKGRPKLTPVAILAGRLLAMRLFGNSTKIMNYQNVATTLFTPLEYGFVGLSEEDAITQYGEDNIEVHHAFYEPLEYVLPCRATKECYMKVVAKRYEDQLVLGVHFIGPNAGEVIQGFSAALNCKLTLPKLFATVGVHVTNAEHLTSIFVTKRSGLDPSVCLQSDYILSA